MDKITNDEAAVEFLRELGFTTPEERIRKVVVALTDSNPTSAYDLYKSGRRRDGSSRNPICAKGTVDKVKKFLKNGTFQTYEQYVKKVSNIPSISLASGEPLKHHSAQQISHISEIQGLVKEFLNSFIYPTDAQDWDDLYQTQYALWQAFKRFIGDARWPMLGAHLGDFADDFKNMAAKLEPIVLIEPRKNRAETRKKITEPTIIMHKIDDLVLLGSHKMPDKPEVHLILQDELVKVIREAHILKSTNHLDIIAEQADTAEWERYGLKQWCSWCTDKH